MGSGSAVRRRLVGRAAELAAVEGFLERLTDGPAALLVEGEPGIGKTSVWTAAVEGAGAAGLRVLRAAPTEPERALTLGGLTDLLADVSEAELRGLPEPQ